MILSVYLFFHVNRLSSVFIGYGPVIFGLKKRLTGYSLGYQFLYLTRLGTAYSIESGSLRDTLSGEQRIGLVDSSLPQRWSTWLTKKRN